MPYLIASITKDKKNQTRKCWKRGNSYARRLDNRQNENMHGHRLDNGNENMHARRLDNGSNEYTRPRRHFLGALNILGQIRRMARLALVNTARSHDRWETWAEIERHRRRGWRVSLQPTTGGHIT